MGKIKFFVKRRRKDENMYKGIMIIVIITIIILSLNFITQNYTKESVKILEENLKNMREDFLEEEKHKEKLEKDIEETFKEWNKRYDILAYYIEHDELEKVENDLTIVRSSIEAEVYDQGVEHIDTCIFLMKHIKEKETFKLKNIF